MKRPAKSYKAFLAAGFLVLLILGFAGHAFANKKPKFVFVVNEDSNNISAYTVDSNSGALTPVIGSPFAAAGMTPTSVAVDPSGKFAYVATRCLSNVSCLNGTVSAYTIDGTMGALALIAGSTLTAGTIPDSVVVDPSGKFVYLTNNCVGVIPSCDGNGTVSAYTIDKTTGALTQVPGSPFAAGANTFSVAVDPSSKFAYVANVCTNLSPGCVGSGTVSAYTIDSTTGALTLVLGSPFAAGNQTSSVAVDPSGKYSYAANDFGTISAYTIDSTTGALTPIPGSPFAASGITPVSVGVDPSGKFAYVANYCGVGLCSQGTVSAYTINATTGALTAAPGSPLAAGTAPNTVAVDPSGKFVYVTNECAVNFCASGIGSVSAYVINSASGALTPVIGSPFAAGVRPHSLAIAGQSTVPCETFQAKVEIDEDRKTSFRGGGFCRLGKTSDGIDPVSESVEFQVGTFSVTIPAGSFREEGKHTFKFHGWINDVDLKITIDQVDRHDHMDRKDHDKRKDHDEGNDYLFTAEGRGHILSGVSNPVAVGLTIGDDEGSTTVNADIDK
jgi:6-phosphogluconolactonase